VKRFLITIIFISLVSSGFSKDFEGKTFLIIFDKSELKANKTSTTYIELSLSNVFSTRAYSGNSDAAIIVKVPYENIDACQLADFFIRINADKVSSLGEIAYQIIDLDESKSTYQFLMNSLVEKTDKNKKSVKSLKATPTP
jgi:hypothetical protein